MKPSELAQAQLDAYNQGDIDSFVQFFHPDVEVFEYPSIFQYRGLADFKERYSNLFSSQPNLHAKLLNRMICGKRVLDHELVSGIVGREPFEAIAIYDVEGAVIKRVEFIK